MPPRSARAATLDPRSGTIRRVQPVSRPHPIEKGVLAGALEQLDVQPLDGSADVTSHVVLSARHPWVEGKGWLEALNPRGVFANSPNMGFVPEPGQPEGRLDVWLDGLEANATYVFRVEVSSIGTESFEVTAVAGGGGYSAHTIDAGGGPQTLLGAFDTAGGGLGLLRITCPDWVFFEVEVSKVG